MSHLKFNVDLVRALIKKNMFYFKGKATTRVRVFISNPKGLHYSK
jgi:hypothetical protein